MANRDTLKNQISVEKILKGETSNRSLMGIYNLYKTNSDKYIMTDVWHCKKKLYLAGERTRDITEEFKLYFVRVGNGSGTENNPMQLNEISSSGGKQISDCIRYTSEKCTAETLCNTVVNYLEHTSGIPAAELAIYMVNTLKNKLYIKLGSTPASTDTENGHHINEHGLLTHTAEMLGLLIYRADIHAWESGFEVQTKLPQEAYEVVGKFGKLSNLHKSALVLAVLMHDVGKVYTCNKENKLGPSSHVLMSKAVMQSCARYNDYNKIVESNEIIEIAYAILSLSHRKSGFFNTLEKKLIGCYTGIDKEIMEGALLLDVIDACSSANGRKNIITKC